MLKRRNPSLVPLTHAASTPAANLPNRQRTPAARAPAGRSAKRQSGDVSGASAGQSPGWMTHPAPSRAQGATRPAAVIAPLAISHRMSRRAVTLIPPSTPPHPMAPLAKLMWFRERDGMNVDLHRSLVGVRAEPATLWEAFAADTRSITLEGTAVDTLGPAHRIT